MINPKPVESNWQIIEILLKILLIVVSLGLGLVLIVSTFSAIGIARFTRTFFETAQVTPLALFSQFQQAYSHYTPLDRYNILVLGTDYTPQRGDAQVLTDSIMMVSVHLTSGEITLISLPRDIYLPSQQMKINALYRYGLEYQPYNPTQVIQSEVENITGEQINRVILLSFEQVAQLIDSVGGVTITVPESFSDPLFPRADVDVTRIRDPRLLYMTVTFEAGEQLMDGETALIYSRSRHSSGSQGNDLARNARQQQVLQALIARMQERSIWLNPAQLGQLYHLYQQNWQSQIPLADLVSLARQFLASSPTLSFTTFTLTEYPTDPNGHLLHPPLSQTAGQWSFLIRNPELLRAEIQQQLP